MMKQSKMAHDSQIVRAKKTSSWATLGPATDKHQAPTHRFKLCVICWVLTNHDNWWNCFKNKRCFVIKWFWGDNLEVTCTFWLQYKANFSDTEAPFLDLNLSITNGIVSSKIYDKRDGFNQIFIFQPKHMLWVLKRPSEWDESFKHQIII